MTDSFADLWNSSTPVKPAPAPQKLGSAIPPTNNLNLKRPRPDVFSLLSSAGSSAANSRPLTPSTTGQSTNSKPLTKTASGDAFSGLVAGSLSNLSNGANMTIAERAAQAEKERISNLQRHQQHPPKVQTSSAWDGLDTLAQSKLPAPNALISEEDDWGLGDFASQPSRPLVSKPMTPVVPNSQPAIWDLDDFTSAAAASTSRYSPPSIPEPTAPRSNSPGDFDFGENGLLDDDSADEDDILGVLSKPVDAIPKSTPPASHAMPSPQPNIQSRTISPPPHIIGQIVEMGFSPQQARLALAATDTGLDVQVAVDTLLANSAPPPALLDRQRPRDHVEDPIPRQHAPARRVPNAGTRGTRDTPSPSGSQQERHLQDQADKLLAQASEIGLSVFNRANAFWAQGKEKVQKVYEERTKAGPGPPDPRQGGRPKWMQDEVSAHDDEGWQNGAGEFSDEVLPPKPSRSTRPQAEPRPQAQSQAMAKTADLFSDEPVAYVSPFRRGRPARNPAEVPIPRSSSPKPAPRSVSPIPLTQRRTVPASPSEIASSAKHKSIGAEKFKLGQYGDAEATYTVAIGLLPESHLLLVPLHNNRALARLKTGDHSGAIEDATTVIGIVGLTYHPKKEAKVTNESEGAGVDLGDGLVKAWRRRAEAYEGKEKWALAQKDWEAVAAADWAGGKLRSEAVNGAGRCRRMVNADSGAPSTSTTKPPVKSSATRPSVPRPAVRREPTPPSEALSKLRQANNAAEAEDRARHELKDTIDSRLATWKGGKETNIRALIASLDSVLWPELGWQKVGMGDLISPSQVKIRYTKAIAKLHPDKLNTNNTTLEQRMIANGVFGTLNEAWNSFKQ